MHNNVTDNRIKHFHFHSIVKANMSVKLLLMLISTIYAVPLPKTILQVDNFDVFQQQTEQNAMDLYKNILIKNLIVTSDNLRLFLNMERSKNYPKTSENQNSFYLPDNDFVDEEEPLLEGQKWTTENPMSTSIQKKVKRQIGGLGGAGGDTQMVLGTFQAMMRPMSTSDIPGLGQNSAQNNQVKEESATLKIEEDTDTQNN